MFLATSQPLAIGERLRLEMKSPDTHLFSVEAVVRRVDLTSDPPGMGVEFVESTNAEKIDALCGCRRCK